MMQLSDPFFFFGEQQLFRGHFGAPFLKSSKIGTVRKVGRFEEPCPYRRALIDMI